MPFALTTGVLLLFVITWFRLTYRIATSMSVFREFGIPPMRALLMIATLLLYLIPLLSVIAVARFPSWFLFPTPLVIFFFVPHHLSTRLPVDRLQAAGLRRADDLGSAIRDTVLLSYAGMAYIGLFWMLANAAALLS